MKATLMTVTACLGLLATSVLRASDSPKPVRATVNFDHPEKFRDIAVSDMPPTASEQAAVLGQFRDFIVDRANSYIPEGYHLTMTFTDIGLAGMFEPWRGPNAGDIRFVKGSTPPSYTFTWAVTGPQGQIVKQGKENIHDLDYQSRLTAATADDYLHYEKAFLDDWMGGHLHDIKKIAARAKSP